MKSNSKLKTSSTLQALLLIALVSMAQAQATNLQSNDPVFDSNIIKSNLDISDYKLTTLSNGLKFLVITNPALAGQTTYGVIANGGGLQNPVNYPRLDQLVADALIFGSKRYPSSDSFLNFASSPDITIFSYGGLSDTSLVLSTPASKSREAIDRVNDLMLNPLFEDEAIQKSLSDTTEIAASIRDSDKLPTQFRTLFIKYFGNTPLRNAYDYSSPTNPLLKRTIPELKQAAQTYFKTYYSSDIMSGVLAFEKWDQSLVDLATSFLEKIPNTKGGADLNQEPPLLSFKDATKLYYKFSSKSGKQGIRLNVVPVDQNSVHQKDYEWAKLLTQLINTKEGLIDQIKAKFSQISSIKDAEITYLQGHTYPVIQIDINFDHAKASSGKDIYSYVTGYLNQNWMQIYKKYGLDILKAMQYEFDQSNLDEGIDFLDRVHLILQNLANDDSKHALDALLYANQEIINQTNAHKFKVVCLEIGALQGKVDGKDEFNGLNYQIIPVPTPTTVEAPTFTLNPYTVSIPATPEQLRKPVQDWSPFINNSIVFAPNPFVFSPFSSVTAIIHWETTKVDANFPKVFFDLLIVNMREDVRLVNRLSIRQLLRKNIVSINQIGLKDSIFLFLNKFISEMKADVSEEDFLSSKAKTAKYYETFFSNKTIDEVLENDQYLTENKNLQSLEKLSKSLDSYGFADFVQDQKDFLDSIKIQWLVATFKEQLSIFQLAIRNLHSQLKINYYQTQSISKQNVIEKSNVFVHKGQKLNSLRIYADFGVVSLRSFVLVQIVDIVINAFLKSYETTALTGLKGEVHFTLDDRIGYNIQASSATLNATGLENALKQLGASASKKIVWENGSSDQLILRKNLADRLSFEQSKDLKQLTPQLEDYITAGCYKCVTDWPKQYSSELASFSLDKLKQQAIYSLNHQIRVIEIPG